MRWNETMIVTLFFQSRELTKSFTKFSRAKWHNRELNYNSYFLSCVTQNRTRLKGRHFEFFDTVETFHQKIFNVSKGFFFFFQSFCLLSATRTFCFRTWYYFVFRVLWKRILDTLKSFSCYWALSGTSTHAVPFGHFYFEKFKFISLAWSKRFLCFSSYPVAQFWKQLVIAYQGC